MVTVEEHIKDQIGPLLKTLEFYSEGFHDFLDDRNGPRLSNFHFTVEQQTTILICLDILRNSLDENAETLKDFVKLLARILQKMQLLSEQFNQLLLNDIEKMLDGLEKHRAYILCN